MFNLGGTEIFVILVIAVLLVRPGDVPKISRKIGRFLGMLRDLKDGFYREMNSMTNLNGSSVEEDDNKVKYQSDEERE